MALTPISFALTGVDWSSPDPFNIDIINALLLAIRERNSYTYFDDDSPPIPTGPEIFPPYSAAMISSLKLRHLNYSVFFTPESVEAGSPENMSEKWIAQHFPLLVNPPVAGDTPEKYSSFLSQWYCLLNICRYVFHPVSTDSSSLTIRFPKTQHWTSHNDYSNYTNNADAYNGAVSSMDKTEEAVEHKSDMCSEVFPFYESNYRMRQVVIFKSSSEPYYSLSAYGGAGAAVIRNHTPYRCSAIVKMIAAGSSSSAIINKVLHPIGFNLERNRNYTFLLEKGDNAIPELTTEFSFPSFDEVDAAFGGESGRLLFGCNLALICVDLSPSYRFFAADC